MRLIYVEKEYPDMWDEFDTQWLVGETFAWLRQQILNTNTII
jgi:hypothetical protein